MDDKQIKKIFDDLRIITDWSICDNDGGHMSKRYKNLNDQFRMVLDDLSLLSTPSTTNQKRGRWIRK